MRFKTRHALRLDTFVLPRIQCITLHFVCLVESHVDHLNENHHFREPCWDKKRGRQVQRLRSVLDPLAYSSGGWAPHGQRLSILTGSKILIKWALFNPLLPAIRATWCYMLVKEHQQNWETWERWRTPDHQAESCGVCWWRWRETKPTPKTGVNHGFAWSFSVWVSAFQHWGIKPWQKLYDLRHMIHGTLGSKCAEARERISDI